MHARAIAESGSRSTFDLPSFLGEFPPNPHGACGTSVPFERGGRMAQVAPEMNANITPASRVSPCPGSFPGLPPLSSRLAADVPAESRILGWKSGRGSGSQWRRRQGSVGCFAGFGVWILALGWRRTQGSSAPRLLCSARRQGLGGATAAACTRGAGVSREQRVDN